MSFQIELRGGDTIKLTTAGKYCDRDIQVKAAEVGYTETDLQAKYDEGKQAEYDRFWNEYQENGNRTMYAGAFAGTGWTAENLKPKFDIICTGAVSQMFTYSGFVGDLAQHFEDLGIIFDTSEATAAHGMFSYASQITRLPEINLTKCGAATSALFTNCSALVTIDKVIFAANNASLGGAFSGCNNLENLTVDGTIGTTGFSVQTCRKLSRESIVSVISALSGVTSGLSVTLSKAAVSNAFADDEWATLVATKTNWTINLV